MIQPDLIELTTEECLHLLRNTTVGRIGVVVDGHPLVLPINFRLIEPVDEPWIIIRTRPGNSIDLAERRVAFEIDGVDPFNRQGWSVLVQGLLHDVNEQAAHWLKQRMDPEPWVGEDRNLWLGIRIVELSGRRLGATHTQWTLHVFRSCR